MDLKKILFLVVVLMALAHAEPEPEAQAEAQAEADAQNLYGSGPGSDGMVIAPPPPIYSPPDYGGGRPDYGGGRPDYGGQPNFGYPPIYSNPDPGFGIPADFSDSKPDYNPGKPDYNPGKPDYIPGGNTCQMTDQCCNMDKQNCCMNNQPQIPEEAGRDPNPQPQQTYTVWERQCDKASELNCPVTVQRTCHPIIVPNCRTVTEIIRKNFQGKQCVSKPIRKCVDIQIEECQMGSRSETEEVTWTNQRLRKIKDNPKEQCQMVQTKECTNRTVSNTINVPVQKQKTINETRQQCQMVQKRQPERTMTVTITRPQYKQMCYDMPVPKCSQTPCATTGRCESGTSACSMQQFNTANVCPQAAAGQTKPPYATGGCQQVQQPACNMGNQAQTCGSNYQQCCRTETRKVCKTVMIRVPQQVQQRVPGSINWVQECKPRMFQIPLLFNEWEQKTVDKVEYDCKPVNKNECHNWTEPEYDVETVQQTGSVEIELPTCNP